MAKKPNDISILFTGDFCPINKSELYAQTEWCSELYGDVIKELLKKDLSVVNLECPLTEADTPVEKQGPNLKAIPKTIRLLKAAEINIVNMANNHIADFGTQGVTDTLEILKKNRIRHVGAGKNLKQAVKPLVVSRKGRKIGFIAAAEHEFNIADAESGGAAPLDTALNIHAIHELRSRVDILVVLVHGGNEFNPLPSPRIVNTFRAFAEAGADAVIGTHPHVPQGFEIYGRTPIFYSLGNFIFDYEYRDTPLWFKSYMIRITFRTNKELDVEIIPYKSIRKAGSIQLMKDEELTVFTEWLKHISGIINTPAEYRKYREAWVASNGKTRMAWLKGAVYPCKTKKQKAGFLDARNAVVCEAHHEVVSEYMKLAEKGKLTKARKYTPRLKKLMKGQIP